MSRNKNKKRYENRGRFIFTELLALVFKILGDCYGSRTYG